VEGGAEMKSTILETFLLGVTFGIGITLLALYTQKPGRFAENNRRERASTKSQRRRKQLQRERLKAVGFSDEEIDKFSQ